MGGQTVFDITTYGGIGTPIPMDEALDFDKGFRLPGYVRKPQDPRIYSEYQNEPELYPIKNGFFVQMGSLCYADFYLRYGMLGTVVQMGSLCYADFYLRYGMLGTVR